MKAILTPEDKKKLRIIGKILNSQGVEDGTLESEGFDTYSSMDLNDINVREWTHFSNHYNLEVPEMLYPILEKVLSASEKKFNSITLPDVEINYGRVDIDIDSERQEISVNYWYSYYDVADGVSTTYEESEDESLTDILDQVQEICDGYDNVELRYNGSGDSGYIEGSFEEPAEEVPASVEDYCYRLLEDLHGGWEINEGSQGHFDFDLKNRTITLHHTYNTEETETYTLFEESFAK